MCFNAKCCAVGVLSQELLKRRGVELDLRCGSAASIEPPSTLATQHERTKEHAARGDSTNLGVPGT
eukprot:443075-Amphidinium_carterae.1